MLLRRTQHWEMNGAIEDVDPNRSLTKSEKEMKKKEVQFCCQLETIQITVAIATQFNRKRKDKMRLLRRCTFLTLNFIYLICYKGLGDLLVFLQNRLTLQISTRPLEIMQAFQRNALVIIVILEMMKLELGRQHF